MNIIEFILERENLEIILNAVKNARESNAPLSLENAQEAINKNISQKEISSILVNKNIVTQDNLNALIVIIGEDMNELLETLPPSFKNNDNIIRAITQRYSNLLNSINRSTALSEEAQSRRNKNFFQIHPGATTTGSLGLVAFVAGIVLIATGFGAAVGVPLIVGGILGTAGATITAFLGELGFAERGEVYAAVEHRIDVFQDRLVDVNYQSSAKPLSKLGGEGPDEIDDEKVAQVIKDNERRASLDNTPAIDQEQDNDQNKKPLGRSHSF